MNRATRDWNDYIGSDPAVMAGKPVLKGTRLTVDFLLSLAAEGWTESQIIETYSLVSAEALHAAFAFAAQHLRDETAYPLEDIG
jgi:uncharacterized protein (DUF433 family)